MKDIIAQLLKYFKREPFAISSFQGLPQLERAISSKVMPKVMPPFLGSLHPITN